MKKRDPIAKSLRSPHLAPQIVPAKKKKRCAKLSKKERDELGLNDQPQHLYPGARVNYDKRLQDEK